MSLGPSGPFGDCRLDWFAGESGVMSEPGGWGGRSNHVRAGGIERTSGAGGTDGVAEGAGRSVLEGPVDGAGRVVISVVAAVADVVSDVVISLVLEVIVVVLVDVGSGVGSVPAVVVPVGSVVVQLDVPVLLEVG
jgi:hypothetical protein